MDRVFLLLLLVCTSARPLWGAAEDNDAKAGADLFRTQLCVNCHSVGGQGAGQAPDLGRPVERSYTPAGIAARMWSHAPAMWSQIADRKIRLPQVTADQAASLFAYFYSAGYFEKPGDVERGRSTFQEKRCDACHSVGGSGGSVGPQVERWSSLTDPVVLVQRMWNHADRMKREMSDRNIAWPRFSSQELRDVLAYVESVPAMRPRTLEFSLPSQEGGAALFKQSGCVNCHNPGDLPLEDRLGDSTLTDVAAALWNHAPQMQQPHPELTLAHMRQILGFVWTQQFFAVRGDAARGRQTYAEKRCGACHG
jgi:mono/diheme cytochrome c family protein